MALHGHFSQHWLDEQGNPAGGVSTGRGFTISWQHGPLGRNGARQEPNGAFVEDGIVAVISRIEFYQQGKFWCQENQEALAALYLAAKRLDDRIQAREARQVEGTHAV